MRAEPRRLCIKDGAALRERVEIVSGIYLPALLVERLVLDHHPMAAHAAGAEQRRDLDGLDRLDVDILGHALSPFSDRIARLATVVGPFMAAGLRGFSPALSRLAQCGCDVVLRRDPFTCQPRNSVSCSDSSLTGKSLSPRRGMRKYVLLEGFAESL